MSGQPINLTSTSRTIEVLQLPPENIPLYWVQETELLIVAKGGDTLAQQLALAFGGVAGGAIPGAISAMSQIYATGKSDLTSYVTLIIAVAGLVASVACGVVHWRHKNYPEKMLKSILSRKNLGAAC